MARFRSAGAVLAIGVSMMAGGCAEEEPPIPPTAIDLAVVATANVNPSPDGRASPIIVWLYQLRTPVEFNTADFFQLRDAPEAVLGASLLDHEQIVLDPGQTISLSREVADDVQFLGAIGAFRDIDNAQWRALVDVPAHRITQVALQVDARRLTMFALPPPKAEE